MYFDEYVRKRRLRFQGVVEEVIPGLPITWHMKLMIRLPAWLVLDREGTLEGVWVIHALNAGFPGIGKIFNPLLRMFISKNFE